ncbi:MAG: hypothetical protein A2X94_13520 [Bdellovibrionales bacterium GWB1_55_8]|nr:MAG: hypothetical protein A2X94_13520 [Bdellovibrionales bacterium GWB1_55_8]
MAVAVGLGVGVAVGLGPGDVVGDGRGPGRGLSAASPDAVVEIRNTKARTAADIFMSPPVAANKRSIAGAGKQARCHAVRLSGAFF